MVLLSNKKKIILTAIEKYTGEHGYPPSIRELCKLVGLKAASTMHRHLADLKESGHITWEPKYPRTLTIVKEETNAV